jgi:sterol desaturase/sphingolipid hydroxylase (fatty acid hydroxylase superfamily)
VDAHTFHHTKNTGNYSLYWAFWDDIMGTNADYKAYVKAQILAENGGGGDSAAAAVEGDRSQ